jgi:hypothetical protein
MDTPCTTNKHITVACYIRKEKYSDYVRTACAALLPMKACVGRVRRRAAGKGRRRTTVARSHMSAPAASSSVTPAASPREANTISAVLPCGSSKFERNAYDVYVHVTCGGNTHSCDESIDGLPRIPVRVSACGVNRGKRSSRDHIILPSPPYFSTHPLPPTLPHRNGGQCVVKGWVGQWVHIPLRSLIPAGPAPP